MRKILLLLLVGIFLISLTSAFSANTFDNNLTAENLTVGGGGANSNQSIQIYLHQGSGFCVDGTFFQNLSTISTLPSFLDANNLTYISVISVSANPTFLNYINSTGSFSLSNSSYLSPYQIFNLTTARNYSELQVQFGACAGRANITGLVFNTVQRLLPIPSGIEIINGFLNLSGYSGGTVPGGSLGTGLQVYYSLNDSSITTAYNWATNGVTGNGTWVVGSPTVTTSGLIGNASGGLADAAGAALNTTYAFSNASNFSLSIWLNGTNVIDGASIIATSRTLDGFDVEYNTGGLHLTVVNKSGGIPINDVNIGLANLTVHPWTHFVLVYNTTDWIGYINGTKSVVARTGSAVPATTASTMIHFLNTDGAHSAQTYNGWVDEIGMWNRTLNDTEVTILYNNNLGITKSNANFSATTAANSITNPRLTVGSINVWNFSGGFTQLNNRTNNLATAINTYLTTQCSLVNVTCYVPFNFFSDTNGTLQYSDLKFDNNGFITNSITYNNATFAGSNENYILNMSYNSAAFTGISSSFVYNNTVYSTTTSGTGDNVIISANLNVPVTSSQVNKSFYWNVSLSNSTATTYYQSVTNNQSISALTTNNCSTNLNPIMNLNMFDQDNNTAGINGSIQVVVNIYTYGTTNLITSFNATYIYTTPGPVSVCLSNLTSTYRMDYQLFYQGNNDTYFPQYNYGQNITLTNTTGTQNLSLYDLKRSTGTPYQINVRGSGILNNAGIVVTMQRQYVGLNQFLTVEAPLTDISGNAIGYFVSNDAVYNFIVTKDNHILGTFLNNQVTCPNPAIQTCFVLLNLGQSTTGPTDFNHYGNISADYLFDKDNRTLYLTYTSTDGLVHTVDLEVLKNDGYANTTICSISSFGTSGTLTCVVPAAYGKTSFYAQLYADGVFLGTQFLSLQDNSDDVFHGIRTVLMVFLYTTLVMLLMGNPMLMIIGAVIGMIIGATLLLVGGGTAAGFGVTVWFIIAAGIIIYQIARRL